MQYTNLLITLLQKKNMSKKKRRKRHILLFCVGFMLLLFSITLILYKDLLSYGWQQLRGQWKIIQGAQTLSYFLKTEAYQETWGDKIRLVQAIKHYAADSLGLDTAHTYASLYLPPPGESTPTMWVVTAAEPYALRAYNWHFPLIGSFPYKGFFNRKAAEAEDSSLRAAGYDTDLSTAAGWSTLGWIENPLLPHMLRRSPGRLADLLLHELTHNTLYVRHDADFNENLASFVARKGTQAFLQAHYENRSQQLMQYVAYMEDYERYYQHFIRGAQQLDRLYRSFSPQLSQTQKETRKQQEIARIWYALDTICFISQDWQQLSRRAVLPNNTFFMSYLRYRGQSDTLAHAFSTHKGTLRSYIDSLKKTYARRRL